MHSHVVTSFAAALTLGAAALAQPCGEFAPGYDYGTLFPHYNSIYEGSIESAAIFDDGSGSGPALFIAGSGLTIADSGTAYVAKFANGRWHAVPGFNGRVHAITVGDLGSGPRLFAGGEFTAIPGDQPALGIAAWDGTTWSRIGTENLRRTRTLLVANTPDGPMLYAAGGIPPFVSRSDGTTWTSIPLPDLISVGSNAGIRALAYFDNGSGPKLYAGGDVFWDAAQTIFGTAVWNGTTWSPLTGLPADGLGGSAELTCMTIVNEDGGPQLYAGGFFRPRSGNRTPLAKLVNGAWQVIPSGTPNTGVNAANGISSMVTLETPDGPALCVAAGPDAHSTTRIRQWRNDSWTDLSPKFTFRGYWENIRTLATTPSGQLCAMGNISAIGSTPIAGASIFNGSDWVAIEPIGLGAGIFTAPSPVLIDPANDAHAYISDRRMTSGAVLPFDLPFAPTSLVRLNDSTLVITSLNLIQTNDGSGWVSLPPPSQMSKVWTSTDSGPETLITAGSDGRLYRHSGGAWSPLNPPISSPGYSDIATFDDGQGPTLYVGGSVGSGVTRRPLLAAVADGQLHEITVPAAVSQMSVFDLGSGPELVIGCSTLAGGVAGVYAWNGDSLRYASDGLPAGASVDALRLMDTGSGPRLWCAAGHALYFWNGTQWEASGLTTNGTVSSMGVIRRPDGLRSMFITGNFSVAGNAIADKIAEVFFCGPNCSPDFNADGDSATDADIEAFFACLAGSCCPTCGTADFNNDGDSGTDADIESFFRVLAGGPC